MAAAGFRGAVSLAVPAGFPDRDLIVFATAVVIAFTRADLRLAVIAHKNATILHLREEGRIDDEVLRDIQDTLDLEQLHATRTAPSEP